MPENSPMSLEQLREKIDCVDSQLINLLAERLSLIAKVGEVKSASGVPIYAPEREASLLAKRRQEADKAGIGGDLIEDILRRLMRESYHREKDTGFKCLKPKLGKIVIIGGGKLGSLFSNMFRLSGYQVDILEKNDWNNAPALLSDPGLVMLAVPIHITEQIASKLTQLPKHCLLVDLTSKKETPLKAMMEAHPGPVLGLHPMFGPDVVSLAKQVIIYCHGRNTKSYQWLLKQMTLWGAKLIPAKASEHDRAMTLVQAMRHLTTFIYGQHLASENPNLKQLLDYSSPIYRLELAMVGRLFAQDPSLYADIIFSSPLIKTMFSHYLSCVEQANQLILANDKEAFIKRFKQIARWFGGFSEQFLIESRNLLMQANDNRQT